MLLLSSAGYFTPFGLFLVVMATNTRRKAILIWTIVNIVLNDLLKSLIRQPRPYNPIFVSWIDKADTQPYGMPSGHIQLATGLCFMLPYSMTVRLTGFLFVALSAWQRYTCNRHTLTQILVGLLLGIPSGLLIAQT